MEFKLVNLTPHLIRVQDGEILELPSEGVARVTITDEIIGDVDGIPVVAGTPGEVTGIPDPVSGVIFIVSAIVLSALNGTRRDVMAPDTGPTAIRKDGQVWAVTRLRAR
jgi:hypothetical protein